MFIKKKRIHLKAIRSTYVTRKESNKIDYSMTSSNRVAKKYDESLNELDNKPLQPLFYDTEDNTEDNTDGTNDTVNIMTFEGYQIAGEF
ncbi:uncharacterized protein L3040_004577 [Drepanopeziza brunnea f. sp. 'multigermtubi']|uniref:uncharacterized protein n=1 Tax=Drepanopeziza brunnea f. sp. 'multigermtubi' TaxID=698441 RepID=UPI00238A3040|nr:hypothetical protein L3040_004577 [Drepanopeziza brunnea f. sp. 'multigermtubi']